MKKSSDNSRSFDAGKIFLNEVENKRTHSDKRLSIEQTASMLSMSESSYKRYKQGDIAPLENEFEQIYRICRYAGKFLFQLSNEDFSGNIMLRLTDRLSRMSPSELLVIEQYIDKLEGKHGTETLSNILTAEMIHNAFSIVGSIYYKILKINLTEDTFVTIKVPGDESLINKKINCFSKFSDCAEWYSESEYLHPENRALFKERINIVSLKATARLAKYNSIIRYQRLIGQYFKPVIMDVITCSDYSDDYQTIFLALRED